MKKPVDINKRPSWDSCSSDMSKYKLSRTEYVIRLFYVCLMFIAIEKGDKGIQK